MNPYRYYIEKDYGCVPYLYTNGDQERIKINKRGDEIPQLIDYRNSIFKNLKYLGDTQISNETKSKIKEAAATIPVSVEFTKEDYDGRTVTLNVRGKDYKINSTQPEVEGQYDNLLDNLGEMADLRNRNEEVLMLMYLTGMYFMNLIEGIKNDSTGFKGLEGCI